MNRFFVTMLLVCMLVPASHAAFSQEKTTPGSVPMAISTGLEGGGYWLAGNRLQTAADSQGLTVENHTSTGSLSNLKALTNPDSPINLAFSQADALQYYLDQHPGTSGTIETLQSIGEECVFIITGSKSGLKTDKDMQEAKRLHLGIKSPNSGIRVTFDYMTSLVPELGKVTVRYGDTVEMINDLLHPKSDIEKAVMVVHRPDARSPEIDMVVANPDKYRFVSISDTRFTQGTADGTPVYRSERVAPGAVEGAGTVQTICVNGLLLANKSKMSPEQHAGLLELVGEHWQQVLSPGN